MWMNKKDFSGGEKPSQVQGSQPLGFDLTLIRAVATGSGLEMKRELLEF